MLFSNAPLNISNCGALENSTLRGTPMKLRKLHIDDYKMFKDFDISFVDENDEALPIVVLAGVNGSGKTTLLEYIQHNPNSIETTKNKEEILVEDDTFFMFEDIMKRHNENNIKSNFFYFPSGIDSIENVANEFVKSFYFFLKEKDYRPSEVKEHFDNYMKEIFNGLDIGFKYSYLDRDDNVWFKNDKGEKFEINDLSTGEKTLLSKVLYLYFQDYTDKVILIDEPELSLHPSWQNKVLKIYENFAKQNNCQIIIATHSPHIISSAKNEYLRFLRKDEEGKIEAIDNITAYGRDIEWVLQQMGVADTRLPKITKRFDEIQELINNQEFDKADDALDKLEYVIGENDKDILALRNDLAFERMDFEEDN